MQAWKTLSRQTLLDMGFFLTVESHTVQLPDGQIIHDWPWLITPDYVNILVETEDNRYLIFRQRKYSLDEPVLAPVGGYLRTDEDPLEGAKREVLEETGYVSERWVHLGSYLVDANRGIATAHLYLARSSKKVAEPESDDLEEQELKHFKLAELSQALESDQFKILAWAMVVTLGLQQIQNT